MSNQRRFALVGAVAVTLAALTACGTQGPFTNMRPTRPFAVQSKSAPAIIAGLKAMSEKLETFSAVVKFWEATAKDESTSTAEVFTARPGKIRANVTEASSSMKKGAKMVYLGDKKVQAKLGFIKKTFAYDDPQVMSEHGWRIDQTDLAALIAGITHEAGTATYLGSVPVPGGKGEAVRIVSPAMLKGVTSEVIVVDPTSFAPLRFEAFIGENVVYRLELSNVKLNPTLPADIFKL